jgi:hypothetical protein
MSGSHRLQRARSVDLASRMGAGHSRDGDRLYRSSSPGGAASWPVGPRDKATRVQDVGRDGFGGLVRDLWEHGGVGVGGQYDAGVPHHVLHTFNSTPAASANVAAPCRRSFSRIGGMPASAHSR